MLNIIIKTIPHKKQRYDTVGDWVTKKGKLSGIFVSDMGNDDYVFLVGIHELIEAYLCQKKGITQKNVDDFDIAYERKRKQGDFTELGNDKKAPYFKQHQFATKVEKMLAKMLKVNWKKYDGVVNSL